MDVIIPTNLVRVLFGASSFNFNFIFFILVKISNQGILSNLDLPQPSKYSERVLSPSHTIHDSLYLLIFVYVYSFVLYISQQTYKFFVLGGFFVRHVISTHVGTLLV